MADIFLSYAREDEQRARRLASALESRGWSVWWDRDIPHGKAYNAYIQEQLKAASCVVVLWSQYALDSTFVLDEADEGLANGRLVPCLLEAVSPPLGHRQHQAAHLYNWDGNPDHEEFKHLVGSIEGRLRESELARSTTPADIAAILERAGRFMAQGRRARRSNDPKEPFPTSRQRSRCYRRQAGTRAQRKGYQVSPAKWPRTWPTVMVSSAAAFAGCDDSIRHWSRSNADESSRSNLGTESAARTTW